MSDINIKTTMTGCKPCYKEEIVLFTRGATNALFYDLTNAEYNFEDIKQFTYLFRQGKNIVSYEMLEYFVTTEDTAPVLETVYYLKSESSPYTYSVYDDYTSEQWTAMKTAGRIFEKASGITGNSQLNSHFSYSESVVGTATYRVITLTILPSETLQFKPTYCKNFMTSETTTQVAVTNGANDYLTIIEPQPRLTVLDSIYGQVLDKQAGE